MPVRHCIACRSAKNKSELVRIVRLNDGCVAIDYEQKGQGRGAYLCKSPQCLTKAEKAGALNRALQCNVPQELYEALHEKLEEAHE